MVSRILLFATVFLSLIARSSADAPPSDAFRILLLAPGGPILLSARIDLAGKGIVQIREDYARDLFTRLDKDNSGALEEAEWAGLPMLNPARAGMPPAQQVQPFLTDGVLKIEGLTKFVNDGLGPLLTITRKQRLEQTVRLLDVLDRDEDGVISVEEVITAPGALHQFDFDDDEALSVSELQPFPNSIRQAKAQASMSDTGGESIAVQVSTDAEIEVAMTRLKDAYNLGDAGGLELARCGLTGSASDYDQNHNGSLQQPEIREWLTKASPDVALNVQFRDNLPPRTTAQATESARIKPGEERTLRAWSIVLDGTPVSVKGMDNRGLSRDSIRLAKTSFRQFDRDKNGYLGPDEYGSLQFGVPFEAVDANHDGMLMIDELETYAKAQAQLSQTRVILSIGDDVRTLFQLMDADNNRFLTPRELTTLAERLKPYDQNGNGKFDRADFVSDYKLTFSFSVPDNLRDTTGGNPQMMAAGGGRKLPVSKVGPVWFQKMDRNRDKDVSWREFLGPRAAFDQLDTNHDGLIDHTEADAAEPAAKETQVSTGS